MQPLFKIQLHSEFDKDKVIALFLWGSDLFQFGLAFLHFLYWFEQAAKLPFSKACQGLLAPHAAEDSGKIKVEDIVNQVDRDARDLGCLHEDKEYLFALKCQGLDITPLLLPPSEAGPSISETGFTS